MSDDDARCAHCGRTADDVPLIELRYQGKVYWICPQGMPVLIHKPQQLAAMRGAWQQTDAAPHEH